jgi:hypothetical protein
MTTTNDGGPAFPIPIAGCTNGSVYNTMEQSSGQLGGMSLRDYFAAKAMPALIADYCREAREVGWQPNWHDGIAIDSYKIADSMIWASKVKP